MPYYSVVIDQEPDDSGYTAWAPALPDCRARGETMAAVITGVQTSLQARLRRLAEEGRPPPDDVAPRVVVLVEVSTPANLHAAVDPHEAVEAQRQSA